MRNHIKYVTRHVPYPCFSRNFMMFALSRYCNVTDTFCQFCGIYGITDLESRSLRGHSRSLILASIESAYMTFYWSSIVTLVLSCRVSGILELLYAESRFLDTTPLFRPKFQGVPFEIDVGVCGKRRPQAN